MNHFVGVGIFWIDLNRADLGCWQLTLTDSLSSFIGANNHRKDVILFSKTFLGG